MTAVQYAAKCGEKLIQAKAACAHGEWLPWLEKNCRISYRHAQRYMRLATELPALLSNTTDPSYFNSVEAAIAYLSAPDEVKAEVDSSTEPVTEKLIKQLKADHEKTLQQKAEALNQPPSSLRSSLRSSLPGDSVKIFALIYILKDLKIRAFAST